MTEWPVLLQRAQQGDKQAYHAFLTAIVPFLRQRGRRYVSTQQLDDFVQEVLLTVHRVLHTYEYALPVEPWLSGILRYKYYESYRRAQQHQCVPLPDDDSWQPAVAYCDTEQENAVATILAPLPAIQARLVYATKVEEISIAEAATRFEKSIAWVKVNVHRSLLLLRDELRHK